MESQGSIRTHVMFRRRLSAMPMPVPWCCYCVGHSSVGRRRVAVLDWAGELDRELQGCIISRVVATPLGTQIARVWVEERRRVYLVG